jgi:CxxC-x17-CxxC domain-containing protein
MEFMDRTIRCLNCGKEFPFLVRDQKYYQQMGFNNPPKRCRECRAQIKRDRQVATDADGNPKEFFKCTCAACGRPAYVPFKPTGRKPVYCRDCLVIRKVQEQAAPPAAAEPLDGPYGAP